MEQVSTYLEEGIKLLIGYLPRLLLAGLVLWIGFKIANRLGKGLGFAMERAGLSKNLTPFLTSLSSISIKVLVVFSAAGLIGVQLASFLAVLAAAGFAVGLALQGSLSNFAAGIIILLFKPYQIEDWIEVDDKFGKVEEIQIFNTLIVTPGQKTLIIPNAQVVDNIVTNYSRKGHVRLELRVTMPYNENYPRVEAVIREQLEAMPKVLQNPAPEVGIETYDSHNIIVGVRPYAVPDDFWEVTFEAYRNIKAAFHDHKIKVAYSEGVEMGDIGG
ncbi:MAG: mechanosensitive ion channel [Phaeodactylibacter sp.]|nr:mechanosensitive ion channel [Phaeodactylibacter sp.]